MFEDHIRYDMLIDTAMRAVVREALLKVKEDGLKGNHHFLVSFLTNFPGSQVPKKLLEKYPEEMTIVIQHQYEALKIDKDKFSIALSFDGTREKIIVPFDALTSFADPAVKFGLKFNIIHGEIGKAELEDIFDEETLADMEASTVPNSKADTPPKSKTNKGGNDNVVAVEFGKKKT
jgi:hypothetical protein